MLDNILNSVKRGAERVRTRSEEVAQVARLKMEVFQLNRELDGHYARLGRSYHAGADIDLLAGIREDIRRVEDEIQSRERLIEELGDNQDTDSNAVAADMPAATAGAQQPEPGQEQKVELMKPSENSVPVANPQVSAPATTPAATSSITQPPLTGPLTNSPLTENSPAFTETLPGADTPHKDQ